ncbi:hypothetical protein [Eubacterium xylanophilum]|nr:hypothetical protein [Eubacterium xylanophilum]
MKKEVLACPERGRGLIDKREGHAYLKKEDLACPERGERLE